MSKELATVFSSDKHVYMFQETISALMNYSEIREQSTVSKEQSIHAMEMIEGRAPRIKSSSLKRLEKIDSEAYVIMRLIPFLLFILLFRKNYWRSMQNK